MKPMVNAMKQGERNFGEQYWGLDILFVTHGSFS